MTKNTSDVDPLAAIDLGMIDSLQTLKKDADVLRERLASLTKMKDELEGAVHRRVSADYSDQLQKLDARAVPLREQARKTWAGLRDAVKRIDNEHEAVLLDQQENDLRHKLGEFDDEEYAKRSKDIEATLKDSAKAHDKAAKLRARFLDVFDSEAELDAAPAAEPTTNPAATPIPPSRTQEMEPTDLDDGVVAPSFSAPPPAPAPKNIASTQILSALNLPQPPRAPAPSPPPSRSSGVSAEATSTAFFRTARLVPQSPEAGRKAIPLPPKAVIIGADSSADIRVGGPSVNPHHARIDPESKGYVLVDLGSGYGTRVNAEPVASTRVLHHEDVIQIGAARFVFRED